MSLGDGNLISAEAFEKRRHEWLPSPIDIAYIKSHMHAVVEPGKITGWVAPPTRGINGQPLKYE